MEFTFLDVFTIELGCNQTFTVSIHLLENINMINATLNIKFKYLQPWPHHTFLDLLSYFQLTVGINSKAYICSPLFHYLVLTAGMSLKLSIDFSG